MHRAGLYVVATPIGNLEDISHRAIRILAEADVVAAEDTRHSRTLLEHYGIGRKLVSLHEHNEEDRIPAVVKWIESGKSVALLSDAGTPLISDPGYRLVRSVAECGLEVIPVPGPSALTAALSVAGLATDRFVFEGFLPAKHAARKKKLSDLASEPRTLVLFESGRRLPECLEDIRDACSGARRAVICRELTKRFESVLRGSLDDLIALVAEDPNQRKGEFVVLLEGSFEPAAAPEGLKLARALLEFLPASQAARVAARVTGDERRAIYEALRQ